MKYFFLVFFLSTPVFSKEVLNYTCVIDKDLKAEISILDKENPSVALFYQKSKFASCLYENTLQSQAANPRAQITDAIWDLKLKTCTTYFEKYKNKVHVDKDVTFKQSLRGPSYLSLLENAQPLSCVPKK